MARSLPLDKAMNDVLIAYAQNGEALRPEQGYPLRLVVAGWEGNISVKWLRRIEVLDGPAMTRWETARCSHCWRTRRWFRCLRGRGKDSTTFAMRWFKRRREYEAGPLTGERDCRSIECFR